MKKASGKLLIVAEILFLYSLFLPAIRRPVLGKVTDWEGWRAMFVAIWSLSDITSDRSFMLVTAAALGNLVFVVAPLLSLRPFHAVSRKVFLGAIVCALILALLTPLSNAVRPVQLLSGYFVWLTAYAALLGSAILACTKQMDGRVYRRLM